MRIMIFGLPGSGKTTYSLKLSQLLGIPVYHLDQYFFTDNWVERPQDEFLKDLQALVAQESWIIEGNALNFLEIRYARADVALCFLLPRWLCLWHIFKRPATTSWKLIKYLWRFEKRVTPLLHQLQEQYPSVPLYIVRQDGETGRLYQSFKK